MVYECRLAEKSYGSKMNELMTTNPAGYYKGIRLLTGSSVRQSVSVYDESGNKLDANAINKYFASICRSNPPISSVPPLAVPSEIPVIFPHEVAKVLERLDPNKATYPGDIPATLYKENAAFLAEPLTAFLNQCILSGTFPDDLKKAVVTPIPKVSNPKGVSDLRPISLTPVVSKVFEHFLKKWLLEDFCDKIDPCQYGFIKESSTVHYLIKIVEEALEHLENKDAFVEILQADLEKAFDKSSHPDILESMTDFRPFLIRIVYSFLHGRQQCVSADGVQSDFLEVFCGIPQGTKTGPVLFLILCNKIATWHENRAKFADDLSLLILHKLGSMISTDGIIRRLEADR